MIDSDDVIGALRRERDALTIVAPSADFAHLWREVGALRARRLQRLLVLAAVIPTLVLFVGGVTSILLGGGLWSGLPLVGVAIWLIVNGAVAPPSQQTELHYPLPIKC